VRREFFSQVLPWLADLQQKRSLQADFGGFESFTGERRKVCVTRLRGYVRRGGVFSFFFIYYFMLLLVFLILIMININNLLFIV
jgi:hypothetical protein